MPRWYNVLVVGSDTPMRICADDFEGMTAFGLPYVFKLDGEIVALIEARVAAVWVDQEKS